MPQKRLNCALTTLTIWSPWLSSKIIVYSDTPGAVHWIVSKPQICSCRGKIGPDKEWSWLKSINLTWQKLIGLPTQHGRPSCKSHHPKGEGGYLAWWLKWPSEKGWSGLPTASGHPPSQLRPGLLKQSIQKCICTATFFLLSCTTDMFLLLLTDRFPSRLSYQPNAISPFISRPSILL